jgi:hypothetical protein
MDLKVAGCIIRSSLTHITGSKSSPGLEGIEGAK